MPSRIFKAVANPPMLLFAPMVPAGASMTLFFILMMFSQALFAGEIGPLWFIAGAIMAHIGLIFWGFKEPHLSTVMQARGQSIRPTRNLVKVRGYKNKYAA